MESAPIPHCALVFVCTNLRPEGDRVCCGRHGDGEDDPCSGAALHQRLKDMVKERRLRGRIRVSKSGCLDRCEDGPNVMVFPDNRWYSRVGPDDLEAILDSIVESLRERGELPRAHDREP